MESSTRSDAEVWRSFKQVLDSPAPITLPPETLYGAITHFLVTQPLEGVKEVVNTVLNSPSLWTGASRRHVRQAVRLAVSAKQQAVRQTLERSYFPAYRERKHLRQWLGAAADSLMEEYEGCRRAEMILGLVEGMVDTPEMDWGGMRDVLEDELVVLAATSLGEDLDMLCPVIGAVKEDRLHALELEDILPRLRQDLMEQIQRPGMESTGASTADAFVRVLRVMDQSREDKKLVWTTIQSFCIEAETLAQKDLITGPSTLLSTLYGIVDILVTSPASLPSTSRHDASVDIAISIISTLSHLGSDTRSTVDFAPVLYGCIDVVEGYGDHDGASNLIRLLSRQALTADRASFILSVGEQLVNRIDASVLRDVLLPLTQTHLREPDHVASFEAAHAFSLAMIKAFVNRPEPDHCQDDFMREYIPAYARSLLKLSAEGSIASDQLRSAYPIACQGASQIDQTTLSQCVDLLLDSLHRVDPSSDIAQAIRLARVAISPHIPHEDLRDHLERLAWCILDVPPDSAERGQLIDAAFSMVIRDLPDESKRMGMAWWMRWRKALSGMPDDRAKL